MTHRIRREANVAAHEIRRFGFRYCPLLEVDHSSAESDQTWLERERMLLDP
jgi:hypothetical protein